MMGEGARLAEVTDVQRLFEGEAGRHDLAPDGAQRLFAERTGIERGDLAEDLLLAMRHEDRATLHRLGLADALGALGTLREQAHEFLIDLIDARTLLIEIVGGLVHGQSRLHRAQTCAAMSPSPPVMSLSTRSP